MFKKGTKINSIAFGLCPKCQSESMYVKRNPYFGKLFKMHEQCSVCGTKYKIEPSFFYGAMYVSYALGVALAIAVFIISKMVFQYELLQSFFAIIAALILLMPLLIRLSRNIWINLFISFDQKANGQKSD